MERSGIAEEEALKRVKSQMSNEERVSRANVVLCTLWHTDVTQKQVRWLKVVSDIMLLHSVCYSYCTAACVLLVKCHTSAGGQMRCSLVFES